jgi:hypothetical protein
MHGRKIIKKKQTQIQLHTGDNSRLPHAVIVAMFILSKWHVVANKATRCVISGFFGCLMEFFPLLMCYTAMIGS